MEKTVKVYSTSACPYCHMAKDFLAGNNIKFESLDVGMDRNARQEMMDKSGQMGVPVIEIDGQVIVGFDKEAIQKAMGI